MFENLSVKTTLKLIFEGNAVLFDIRSEEAYKKGHLPTAKHVPEEKIKEELERWIGKTKILYCDYGNLSLRLAKEYSEKGYQGLASMVGGYHAYEGYIETEKNSLWTMEWKARN